MPAGWAGAYGQTIANAPSAGSVALIGQPVGTSLPGCAEQSWQLTSVPVNSPAQVDFSLAGVQALQMTATGTTHNGTAHADVGPDGANSPAVNVFAGGIFGIGQISAPLAALIGVFTGDAVNPAATPPLVEYWGGARDVPVIRPMLQQPFLIGTGQTAGGTLRTFIVPAGATRLYLGVADPCPGTISGGNFQVTLSAVALPNSSGNPIEVPGIASLMLAGQPAGSVLNSCASSAPLSSPVQPNVPVTPGLQLQILAGGAVVPYNPSSYWYGTSYPSGDTVSPNGTGDNTIVVGTSIGRITAPVGSLIGLFAGDSIQGAAPPDADFSTQSTRDQPSLSPALQQPFFIGSGQTSGGGAKTFTAPAGATRLFLGIAEPCPEANRGSFSAAVTTVSTPSITPGEVGPVFSTSTTIQPGEWVSIYGSNLATASAFWNGDFPISLGGTSVTIDGKPAYLSFVSPTQINLQAPDDSATGAVPVVVKTASGSASSTVTLAPFGPSFSRLDSRHVAGIILRFDGSGAYGGGAYDILGPTGSSLGYSTVAAKAGDSIELFGVGFGPTNPPVPAGQAFAGAAAAANQVNLLINNVNLVPVFSGLSAAGLYQFNFTVPAGLGTGDVLISATVGGAQTPSGVVISLQ
jgi:uncharacterized protein (TIGR03437 family)